MSVFLNREYDTGQSMYFRAVDRHDLIAIMKTLKNKKTEDIYGINVYIVKCCGHLLLDVLVNIINTSLSVLKLAKIFPIHKKGPQDLPLSFRHISVRFRDYKGASFDFCAHQDLTRASKSVTHFGNLIFDLVLFRRSVIFLYSSDLDARPWDFQAEECALRASVDRFNNRRYNTNQRDVDYEPVDNSISSVLGVVPDLSVNFMTNYNIWLEQEVFEHTIEWEELLKKDNRAY